MVSDEVLKKYIFNLLLENGYEVKEIVDFGRTGKENQLALSCTTDDVDNDLICYFDTKEENGKTKVLNIKVF